MVSVTLPISCAACAQMIHLFADAGRLAGGLFGDAAGFLRIAGDLTDGGGHLLGGGGHGGQVGGGLFHTGCNGRDVGGHLLGGRGYRVGFLRSLLPAGRHLPRIGGQFRRRGG